MSLGRLFPSYSTIWKRRGKESFIDSLEDIQWYTKCPSLAIMPTVFPIFSLIWLLSQIVVNEHSQVLYVVFAFQRNGFIRIMAEKFQIYLIVMASFYLFWPLFGWGQKRLNRRLKIYARKLANASDFDNLRVRKISTSKRLRVRIIHVSQTKGKNLPVVSQVC